jgi:hypothetical protein
MIFDMVSIYLFSFIGVLSNIYFSFYQNESVISNTRAYLVAMVNLEFPKMSETMTTTGQKSLSSTVAIGIIPGGVTTTSI